MVYINLFITFFIIGLVSFGGGYAILPLVEEEVISHGWMTTAELSNVIALASMTPGSIAINSSTLVGFNVAGVLGAFISTTAMVMPSLIIVVIVSNLISKIYNHRITIGFFQGLRPVIIALIVYAAIRFGITNGVFLIEFSYESIITLFIFILSGVLLFTRLNPMYIILISGILGIILF